MFRAGLCVATGALMVVVAWLGVAHFTSVEAAVSADNAPPDAKPAADAKDAKGVDLSALRDAVDTAGKRGENVDEIRKALDAFAKTAPKPGTGVTPQLQALRDAVDSAGRKGENVEGIAKELSAVEMTVAGKSLVKPRVEPKRPEADPNPNPGRPAFPFPQAFPNPAPFQIQPIVPAGIDVEMFNKAMELQRKAMELMLKNPRDPEARKMQNEAAELLLKAARGMAGAGGIGGFGGVGGLPMPAMPLFPNDFGRIPDRARFGIRMDRVPAMAVDQLGLEPNTGIAVAMVMPGSVAEKAGLKVHDIILQFAGKAVTDNTEDFIRMVNGVKAGEKIDLVVLRKGKKVELKGVELPEVKQNRPQVAPFDLLDAQPKPRPSVPPLPKKD
jgi:serine protease Do